MGVRLVALLLLVGCEKVDYIEIIPADVTLTSRKDDKWLQAHAMARNGVRAVQARVEWSSLDPSVATVNERGLVKPVKSGVTEVVARHGSVEGRAQVQVRLVDRLSVSPQEVTLRVGEPAPRLTVEAFTEDGLRLPIQSGEWTTGDGEVVRVSADGQPLALAPGQTTVEVQVDGKRASVQVKVVRSKSP